MRIILLAFLVLCTFGVSVVQAADTQEFFVASIARAHQDQPSTELAVLIPGGSETRRGEEFFLVARATSPISGKIVRIGGSSEIQDSGFSDPDPDAKVAIVSMLVGIPHDAEFWPNTVLLHRKSAISPNNIGSIVQLPVKSGHPLKRVGEKSENERKRILLPTGKSCVLKIDIFWPDADGFGDDKFLRREGALNCGGVEIKEEGLDILAVVRDGGKIKMLVSASAQIMVSDFEMREFDGRQFSNPRSICHMED
jgi:hypothetical protein